MPALFFLFLPVLELDRLGLAALPFERGIIAASERQFRLVEMQDMVADRIEQVAIVADDDQSVAG